MSFALELVKIISLSLSALSLSVGFVLLFYYRRKIWRSKLTEKQLDYLLYMYDDLCYLNVESHNSRFWAKNIKSLNRSIDEFKREQPDDYARYVKQKEIYLNYRMQSQYKNYILIPSNNLKKKIQDYFRENQVDFAPTMSRLSSISEDEFTSFNSRTIDLIDEISNTIKHM